MLLALHNVIAGFLRRTWLVAAITVVVCAAFAARAVAALSDAALSPDGAARGGAARGGASPGALGPAGAAPSAAPAPAPAAPARPAAPHLQPAVGDSFVQRNIFCSACAPPKAGPGGGAAEYQGQPAVLIATSLGTEPRATVRVVPTEIQGSWGLGEDIPGVGRIDEIHATAIQVADADGHTKLISLIEAAAGGGGDTRGPRPPDSGAPKPFEGRYEKLSETEYAVDRSLVRELVTSGGRPGMGAATPIVVNGEVQGLRLVGLGAQSPGRALGLRSGDQVTAIDGAPLRNVQQLLDLFARLDQTAEVQLGITRAGKPFALTLKLR
ncbi:MAG TPA: hypothetical protein VNO30_23295 [Kofleriaceae bacterium]|nr:hypothetical protein [Kofleriaceae bacterium]